MNNKNAGRDKNRSAGERRRPAAALLMVLLLAAAFFVMSDAPAVKGLRDGLFEKLGYVSEETADDGGDGAGQKSGEGSGRQDGGGSAADGAGQHAGSIDAAHLPEYNGSHYVSVNNNVPEFPEDVYERASLMHDEDVLTTKGSRAGRIDRDILTPYEYYVSLDSLGRCTGAYGCLGEETMPARGEERGDISSIHPSGWAKGQDWERSHLIAWALGAENANPCNLVTGTHYLNYDGMRPLEEEVEHYIWDTGNHVLYYSKPWFSGDELVPRGVQMVARSVEDEGSGISFNVYCFNVTPGADIDYKSGVVTTEEQANQPAQHYVINKRSGVFHYPDCEGAQEMSPHNREEVTATRKELTEEGFSPCGSCKP